MIQIDGFSRKQLEEALRKNRMPFLRSLLEKQNYKLQRFYSGMPSSTPAVQGELFYGVKGIVPGFSYYDKESQQVFRMFESVAANTVESHLEQKGEHLLAEGSSYSNIYSGGAKEVHFCVSKLGFNHLFEGGSPFALPILFVLNIYSFVRTGVLLGVEFVLAVIDFIRGLIDGRDLWGELKSVPTRVGICVLLRELIAIGVKIDVTRGNPIIHANFVGYDEQAHRRGPSSRFAHWTLRGIDDAIERIYRASQRSRNRDYTFWVYSDHGQSETIPYTREYGRSIETAVDEVLNGVHTADHSHERRRGNQFERAMLLGWDFLQRFISNWGVGQFVFPLSGAVITAQGPLGHIYPSESLERDERNRLARDLVDKAKIPLVLTPENAYKVRAWTEEGDFPLPGQTGDVFGNDHPFLEEMTRDLIDLCHHPSAGEFIICGWRKNGLPINFPMENGSHAGPGVEETHGFALLPPDTLLPPSPKKYIRPIDLREAAFQVLRRHPIPDEPPRPLVVRETLRVMTYNIHSCVGMDGKTAPRRIAQVIAQQNPDIVALQEVDVGKARTNHIDQAELIAKELRMTHHFHPAIRLEEEQYGDAIISRFPMRLKKAGRLPGFADQPFYEPRGALWVEIDLDGISIEIINTHLSLKRRERLAQAKALLGEDWIENSECQHPVIVCGDLNTLPGSPVYRKFHDQLRDVQVEIDGHRPQRTWFSRYPIGRIDYIFCDPRLEVLKVVIPDNDKTRVASDHLPLVVDLKYDR